MKSKKIIAASLGAALSLSMLCMPVYATSPTVSSIVANTQVGDGQREVSSFEIEVSDESIIQNLTAADFDIINNSSTVPFDVNTGSWAEAYQDDGIELSVSGNLDKIKSIESVLNDLNLNYKIENMDIKNPKNGYKSIHLNYLVEKDIPLEIQIKTKQMKAAQDIVHDKIYKNFNLSEELRSVLSNLVFLKVLKQ